VTTILAFAFVIGVLVFVHELGHFLAARRVGVRVLKFSIGFGPRIVGFTRGDTEYCISAIPLGGYVKMAGENAEDQRQGKPDEFLSKTKWERFQVLIAGPLSNILLAIVVLAFVLMQGADVPAFQDQPPVVGAVERNSPAARAGLQVGDRILRIDGRAISTWEQFYLLVGTKPQREVLLTVERNGQAITIPVVPRAEKAGSSDQFEVGDIGVFPNVHPRVRSVTPGEPADRAGVKRDDVVLAVNGEPISFANQLSEAIGKNAEKPIRLSLLRDGRPIEIEVVPARSGSIGRIGIGISNEMRRVDPGVVEAFRMSVQRNWETAGLILTTLQGLLTGETSPKQLMGPVGIAQLSGESANDGWMSLFGLMASISLNLGLLNLLPIPVLDGGHILILFLEGLARRDFSVRMKERMLFAGFVLLMLLMVTVIYNDLTRIRWVENLMFWR
jgi:regulator of sigma E protease